MFVLQCVLLFILSNVALATTYYVKPTGLNSNPGTSLALAFQTIQNCVNNMTAAGDTCMVDDGTYSSSSFAPVALGTGGSSGNPKTLKSINQYGARIIVRTNSTSETMGVYGSGVSWWVIDGFDVRDDGGAPTSTTQSINAFYISGGSSNIVIKNNKIHDIGRLGCAYGAFGWDGILLQSVSNITVTNNILYTIGRKRTGESGCALGPQQGDHGVYVETVAGLTMAGNVIYDTNRGWPIHIYSGSSPTSSSIVIINNTLADGGPNPIGPFGQILISGTINGLTIKNNILYNPFGAPFTTLGSPTLSSVSITNNLTNSTDSDWYALSVPSNGAIGASNLNNTNPQFTNAGSRDYSLISSSPAINAGTAVSSGTDIVGTTRPQGAAYDIGAYEFSSTIPDTQAPAPPTGVTIQ